MNNLEHYHQITIDEYIDNQNETLEDLEQKRVVVAQDILFLAETLEIELKKRISEWLV